MNMIRSLMCVLVLTTGCVHLDSVSTSPIPIDRSRPIAATCTRFLFLLINHSNDYVNELTFDLARQCPNGRVDGILTKQEFVTYFPLIAHRVNVTAHGYCVVGQASK